MTIQAFPGVGIAALGGIAYVRAGAERQPVTAMWTVFGNVAVAQRYVSKVGTRQMLTRAGNHGVDVL